MTTPTPEDGPAGILAPANALERLRAAVLRAAQQLLIDAPGGAGAALVDGGNSITLERPRLEKFGDYSTNAALLLAPSLKAPPRDVAERLGEALAAELGEQLQRFEVAGPGFVNLFLADAWLMDALAEILAAGDSFGVGQASAPQHILVEFVSANPTGPMHVGHARNAAYGDVLARMLALHGHRVEREFYVNDAGSQVRKLGESIAAVARGEQPPEDGYQGEYVGELAAAIENARGADPAELGRAAVAIVIESIKASLAAFGVAPFDHWFFESALHEGDPSPVTRALAVLAEQGHSYHSEGALWLRTTDFGDDKDRVLVRSNGEHTYFASDIAYHQNRLERGLRHQIDVWGSDHHGYVQRMKAAYEALGGNQQELELLIMQLVHLVRSGERTQMSKRAGEFVTLDELVVEVGVDAARWYLLARSHDRTVDLDLDLAREQSAENPVYYVQYAHARIASMLARVDGERLQQAATLTSLTQPLHPSERALVKRLLDFPAELAEAVQMRGPHRIVAYALDLAQTFTAFYRDCRVLGAEPADLELLRIALCLVSARTIARCLGLLGVSAPDQM
ncbi:MAG: arginine--tRNA ligase [Solirubrobacteraceae bacterium]